MNITIIDTITDEIVAAVARLLPQLDPQAALPGRSELAEIIASPAIRLFVARDPAAQDEIAGMLTLILFRTPTGRHAAIEDVVVDGGWRGQGIGEALTRAALAHAKAAGARGVDLTSRPAREAANRLYQRIGFVKRETNVYRYNFPKDD
jgi:ribosomal protein S18 acetylase RimI-like enzyme